MKKNILSIALLAISFGSFAQTYEFQTVKDIEANPVISQDNTGTCWSFSTTSFLEAEIIRLTGKKIDLSEMYNVRNTYPKKAWNYVMRQGKAQFGEGALAHDVINSAEDFGLVPNSVYSGLTGNNNAHNHAELTAVLESMLKTYVANPGKKLSPQWKEAVNAVLDVYLGKNVTDFTYEGKKYTPKSFLEMTKLKTADYVTISSFTNEPFYKTFLLDIPDNFSNGTFYNLPLDEYVQNIDNALDNGYTIALDCDVSEGTFSGKNGVAVIPENDADAKLILTEIKPEKVISPEYRQAEFENLTTTDDHLMHIVGKVKDQTGKTYYKVKNSWGTKSGKEGFVYMSVSYMKLKSISVLLHKDGLTKNTKSKLGL
ncbi:C1 family peptidase [Flavobacterium aquatile]|uniref:Aminopeptidase n=1 Tax=Flavobacterium aquatile LMG 4008 = ATCC 11947 TaxID=1453498 RepID=A0A095SS23_9FLAO|nr:C1 family peptidase [Flavobacterium aquatile]KGD67441.1 aminopeptidase [Flavobacterium aquatile LMG 4008 = ATCC 11947]OXA66977.1 aminopeptidase [Flavobacterium aquatile] [Flavobacterium aquatile LMG 4008 = ATCC 11947]GEC78768.1 aminopeptidase [Flavobacterium aquatile]